MGILIREALPADADAIREVQRLTWLTTYPDATYGITKEDIEARFREDPETLQARRIQRRQALVTAPFHSWVALEKNMLIGFCIVKQEDQENILQALYVLPGFQGKGAGKCLLQTALDWLGTEKAVALNVVIYNKKAIAFYHSFGFVSRGLLDASKSLQLPSGVFFPEISMVKSGS